MDDQFLPLGWSQRPENWMYRLPATVFGRLPASWAPQLPPLRSSSAWDQGTSNASATDRPTSRGILSQFDSPPVDPWSQPLGATAWNSHTIPNPFTTPAGRLGFGQPALRSAAMGTDIESPVHPDLPSQQLLEGINQQQRYPFEGQPSSRPLPSPGVTAALDAYCKRIRDKCIAQCSETHLPSGDYGFNFWNCVNKCMQKFGCPTVRE
jgi:hypothetical protein